MSVKPLSLLLCFAFPREMQSAETLIPANKALQTHKLITGVWVIPACLSIAQYAQTHEAPDLILNIGLCGTNTDAVPKLIQAVHITHPSSGAEVFADCIADVPIHELWTVDRVVTQASMLQTTAMIDMEAFGIVSAAKRLFPHTPCLVFKIPYDHIPSGSLPSSSIEDLFAWCQSIFETQILPNILRMRDEKESEYDTHRLEQAVHCTFQTRKMLRDLFFLWTLAGQTPSETETKLLEHCKQWLTIQQAITQVQKDWHKSLKEKKNSQDSKQSEKTA